MIDETLLETIDKMDKAVGHVQHQFQTVRTGRAAPALVERIWSAAGFSSQSLDRIGEEDVHLGLVEMPILNIYAEQDHLVPPDASRALKGLVGTSDYTELSFRGGHIGIYVSGRAQKEVPQTIHDWLTARSGRSKR